MANDLTHRVTIDLTPAAKAEAEALCKDTGTSTAALFRTALVVMRMMVDAKAQGKDTVIGGTKVELPWTIRAR